ncbi:hypothetical protein [Streptacidiphilus sp. EB129]|uniref:hypothetical protein n=1 Tax=Streptacidiphilus sp. EB129 TaxID=3156262 RepID=UPI0035174A2D
MLCRILVAALLCLAAIGDLSAQPPNSRLFGTLQSDPSKAVTEHAAGIRVASLPIYWDRYEPAEGVFDSAYIASVKSELASFQAAGMLVEASIGIESPPSWVTDDQPGTRYTDQYGDQYTATADLVFSQVVRNDVQGFAAQVGHDIGLANFWAIRIGVDSTGEYSYPPASYNGHSNTYWAFGPNAQSSGPDSGRPPTIGADPFPGWRPGQTQYDGRAFTTAEVGTWYSWYLASLADAVNWQIATFRATGYQGLLRVLVPGTGFYPDDYRSAVRRHLDGTTAPSLLAQGVGFFITLGQITDRDRVEIVPTSLVNGTGTPRNNGCGTLDGQVDIMASASHEIYTWSSVRWITDIARRDGFTLVGGESAGNQIYPYYPGVMADAAHQMASCGLADLMWAFDADLYNGTSGSSLADYATAITAYG